MYKVMLIDDEEWVLKALEQLIEWEKHGFNIIGKCSCAAEAEAIIRKHSPDIIISDVRMPGMSGLDLLEKINRNNENILTIFISAYEDFSYAQKALSLGAFDYILKPVDEAYFIKSLNSAVVKLNEMKATSSTVESFRNANLFYELLELRGGHKKILKKLIDYGMQVQSYCYRIVIIKGGDDSSEACFVKINNIITNMELNGGCSFLNAYIGNKKWVYLINYNDQNKTLGRRITKEILSIAWACDLSIGISKDFADLDELSSAYKQADMIEYYRFIQYKRLVYTFKEPDRELYESLLNDIRHVESIQQLKELIVRVPKILRKLKAGFDIVSAVYNTLINRISDYNRTITESDYIIENSVMEEYPAISQVIDFLLEKLMYGTEQPSQRHINNAVIREVLKDIETSYNQKLMISSLAEKYHINTSYLSVLFKRETGKSFINYLIEYRMDKAAELLREDELTTFEISEKVGYDDYFHFNKLFKKYKHVTPGIFRKKIEAGDINYQA